VNIGNPRYGKAVAADRRSKMQYVGVGVPETRALVKRGFAFYELPESDVLAVWDALWRGSPFGEVLFCALDYYDARARKRVSPVLWPVVQGWVDRVDNWAHCDGLAGLYSRILEAQFDDVYPRLQEWNQSDEEWRRRISLVSLIHYTGKNAVFLLPEQMLPLVTNCLGDPRYYVQKAVGWVLREMWRSYPAEIRAYVEANLAALSAPAFSRAIERLSKEEASELRALRKAAG
jgi:3-methyladenine DNA glycosylase AlkD